MGYEDNGAVLFPEDVDHPGKIIHAQSRVPLVYDHEGPVQQVINAGLELFPGTVTHQGWRSLARGQAEQRKGFLNPPADLLPGQMPASHSQGQLFEHRGKKDLQIRILEQVPGEAIQILRSSRLQNAPPADANLPSSRCEQSAEQAPQRLFSRTIVPDYRQDLAGWKTQAIDPQCKRRCCFRTPFLVAEEKIPSLQKSVRLGGRYLGGDGSGKG